MMWDFNPAEPHMHTWHWWRRLHDEFHRFSFMNRAFSLRKYGKLQLHNFWALHFDFESCFMWSFLNLPSSSPSRLISLCGRRAWRRESVHQYSLPVVCQDLPECEKPASIMVPQSPAATNWPNSWKSTLTEPRPLRVCAFFKQFNSWVAGTVCQYVFHQELGVDTF